MTTGARYCVFGPYTIDKVKRLLWCSGKIVPLPRKTFEVLLVLLEHRGQVVEKEEIFRRVWVDSVVEENTLVRHVATLRKALNERPDQHDFIVTAPGHGYEFVAPVTELENLTGAVAPSPVMEEVRLDAPARPDRLIRTAMAFGAAVLLLIAVGGMYFVGATRHPQARSLRLLTHSRGLQQDPTWAPDGQSIAFASDEQGNLDIWVKSVGDERGRRLTSSAAQDWQPDWSPDGKWIVFRSDREGGGLYVVPAQGGVERRVTNFGYQPKWSPDSTRLLFASGARPNVSNADAPKFYLTDVNGTAPIPVRADLLIGFGSPALAWVPGTARLSLWGQRGNEWTFLTADLTTGPVTRWTIRSNVADQIKQASLTLSQFRWSRSGRDLYFEGDADGTHNLWRVGLDPGAPAWVDGPERLTTGQARDANVALSPDGTRLAFASRSERTRLWAFPFDASSGRVTGEGAPITLGGADEQDPSVAADGTRLVYRTVHAGRQGLWQRSLSDGTEQLLLEGDEWQRTNPHWSHDGTALVYQRRRATGARDSVERATMVLPTNGGRERVLAAGSASVAPTDWSPDGAWILGACSSASLLSSLCLLPVSSAPQVEREIRVVASDPQRNVFAGRFSPDQRWIAFNAVDPNKPTISTIEVASLAGGAWTAVSDAPAWDDKTRWAADGRTIYFVSNRSGSFNVWGRRFHPISGKATGEAFRVTAFDSPRRTLTARGMEIAVLPTRLVVPVTEATSEIWMLDRIDR